MALPPTSSYWNPYWSVQALRENDTLCIEKWLTTVTVISPFRLGIRRLMKILTYTIYSLLLIKKREDKKANHIFGQQMMWFPS